MKSAWEIGGVGEEGGKGVGKAWSGSLMMMRYAPVSPPNQLTNESPLYTEIYL